MLLLLTYNNNIKLLLEYINKYKSIMLRQEATPSIYSSIGPSLLDLIFRLLAGGGAWPCGQASHFGKPIPRMRGRSK